METLYTFGMLSEAEQDLEHAVDHALDAQDAAQTTEEQRQAALRVVATIQARNRALGIEADAGEVTP